MAKDNQTDNDTPDFRDLVGDVKPIAVDRTTDQRPAASHSPGLAARRAAAQAESKSDNNFLSSAEYIPPVKPWDELSYKRDGVQHGVFKNLRLGKYQIDARLDLHRHSVEQARKAVFEFIQDARELDIRCVLISHGKGEGREKPALLKSCVNYWLREFEPVLAFHSAQKHHGGTGATYVLLRKSQKKSDENRERHQTKRKGI